MDKMKIFWSILLVLSTGIALWFTGSASVQLWRYYRLPSSTEATVQTLGVEEISPSAFAVSVTYLYEVEGKTYEGKTLFSHPYYLNRPSAERDLEKKWQNKTWKVWYSPRHPHLSTLQKIFPFNPCVQALISLAVCVYFFALRAFARARARDS